MESYPATQVTNYGITLLEEGIDPHITYVSPDGDLAFYIHGGLAPFPGVTEGIVLADGPEGLHPIFTHLDHKGARQAGVTWAGTVYAPAEMTFDVIATANTTENFRKIIRKWMAAWDPERQGTLSWVTPDGGEWWCHPRLFRAPQDQLGRAYSRNKLQRFRWSIRNDDAFWRSHDSVSQFQFAYKNAFDTFNRDDGGTLGANWDQTYSGAGSGVCETQAILGLHGFGRMVWTPAGTAARTVVNRWLGIDEIQTVTVVGTPDTYTLTYAGQTTASISHPATAATIKTRLEGLSNIAVDDVSVSGDSGGPYTVTFLNNLGKQDVATMSGTITAGGTNPYVTVGATQEGMTAVTSTDYQVITFRIGDYFSFPFPSDSYLDIWGRLDSAGTTGVRLRIGQIGISIYRVNAGVETEVYTRFLLLPPLWWETWSFVLGTDINDRHFMVYRSGFPIVSQIEVGTGSALGASYRGSGNGMHAAAGILIQHAPPTIDEWSMGDNLVLTQSGYLNLTNFGDQVAYPDYICYGPGTFKFGDGPGVEATIEFGRIEEGQVALLRTHPGDRNVYDITADYSEQDLPFFQTFLKSVLSLAFNGNIPPLVSWFESLFGISPPQGNMYTLLRGRFSKGIPPRGLGLPETHKVSVQITGGSANSRVVASITPMRRWPE